MLPKTQHDLSSFVVDTWSQTVSACFLPRAGPGSRRWVGGAGGDWAPGLFPFRKRCSASPSAGCSRKVSVCRAPSPDAALLPPPGQAHSQNHPASLTPSLPFSSPPLPFPTVFSSPQASHRQSRSELCPCLSALHTLGVGDTGCGVWWLSSQILTLRTWAVT